MSTGILGKAEILDLISPDRPLSKRLFISPLACESQVNDTSIDLRLGHSFLVLESSKLGGLDLAALSYQGRKLLRDNYREVRVQFGQYFTLHPGHSVQVGTMEYLGLPTDIQGYITLRKSIADLPLVASTAQLHPGHKGIVTLTLTSNAEYSMELYPGVRIAELQLQRLGEPITTPTLSRHHSMIVPSHTRLHRDEELAILGPTVEPIIVGVASTLSSGRSIAVDQLVNIHGFTLFSLTDVLKGAAVKRGVATSRRSLQEFGVWVRQAFGDDYLAATLRNWPSWLESKSTRVVVDGFKHTAEVKEFRKQRYFSLLGVDADEEIRWQRVNKRNRREDPKSREEFQELCAIDRGDKGEEHGQQMTQVLEQADKVILNNGEMSDFLKAIDRFARGLLNPPLR